MATVAENPNFKEDYQKLKKIKLNPDKHLAETAFDHTEMVVKRVEELARQNQCTEEEIIILRDLAYVHDIGKITGNANPSESVTLLARYGITDENFMNLVKYHDINLPWYQLSLRGESPSDKSWGKMASKLDVWILCLFMIADRVDSPGGWRTNQPLMWFLDEVKKKGFLIRELKVG